MNYKIIILLIAAFLVGCQGSPVRTFQGAKKDSEVAKVRLWSSRLQVVSIDGKKMLKIGNEPFAYVLPGKHDFKINITDFRASGLACGWACRKLFNYTAELKAGHTYIFVVTNMKKHQFRFIDKGTNYPAHCFDKKLKSSLRPPCN